MEKAFDDLLRSKLSNYGISGKAKLLLESYLQNRYKRVQINNSYVNSNTSLIMDKNKIWGATGFNFEPIVIPSIHE